MKAELLTTALISKLFLLCKVYIGISIPKKKTNKKKQQKMAKLG